MRVAWAIAGVAAVLLLFATELEPPASWTFRSHLLDRRALSAGTDAPATDPTRPAFAARAGDDEGAAIEPWIIGLTGVIAFAALLQCVGTVAQVVAYRRQARVIESQLRVTEKAGDAAKSGVMAAAEATAMVNRAYVNAAAPRLQPVADAATQSVNGFEIRYALRNAGLTPARRVIALSALKSLNEPPDEKFDYGRELPGGFWTDIAAGETRSFDAVRFPMASASAFSSKAAPVYIWGWVEYNDVFDAVNRRRSEFCLRMDVSGDLAAGRYSVAFTPVGPHNGMDRDCLYPPGTSWPAEQARNSTLPAAEGTRE